MKHFSCGSVVAGCQAVFSASDDNGILGLVADHAAADHGLTEVSPELVASVRANITDAPVAA